MRFPLAALALAAFVCLSAQLCPAAQAEAATAPTAEPVAAPTASAVPTVTDTETPPPFIARPKRPPQPVRPDTTFASRPAPESFRGLAWGAPLEQAKASAGLQPVANPRPLPGTFFRPDEPLKLGMADIRTVAYYFPKGTLRGVGIMFEGEANFFLVKDYLIELYGPGRQVGDRYGWTWKSVHIDLRLRDGAGELRYTYEP